LGIHTGDVRYQVVTTMPQTVGLVGGIPLPLLFIQTGQQHVHLVVQRVIWMWGFLPAMRTLALMDGSTRHGALQRVTGPV
jgi:hypothetical protein